MPIYEYICDDCGHRYERIVLTPQAAISCPGCGSERHTLQLSVFRTPRNRSIGSADEANFNSGCGCTPSSCGCK